MIKLETKVFMVFVILLLSSNNCMSNIIGPCRTLPALTKEQLELCYQYHDVTFAAIDGLEMAVKECQYQFQWNRWNCSSLNTKSRNPHASNLLKKGYRESAFAYAVSAAGVAHSVARACSQGRLISCGCDPSVNRRGLKRTLRKSIEKDKHQLMSAFGDTGNEVLNEEDLRRALKKKSTSRWKWGGCSHNMDFGVEFSELFLDTREKGSDIQTKINLHNNHAGRKAVSTNMLVRCKCHGMSGSCSLKTCWKSAPEFRVVGKILKQQFRQAIMVVQSNMANGKPEVVYKSPKKTRKKKNRPRRRSEKLSPKQYKRMENMLFYYQRSPNFCDKDATSDILGTVGRKCNHTSIGNDGCSSMCCGRGYNVIRERRIDKCHCKFHWCCTVECQECEIEEWTSVCK